jgi:hypothetical protein
MLKLKLDITSKASSTQLTDSHFQYGIMPEEVQEHHSPSLPAGCLQTQKDLTNSLMQALHEMISCCEQRLEEKLHQEIAELRSSFLKSGFQTVETAMSSDRPATFTKYKEQEIDIPSSEGTTIREPSDGEKVEGSECIQDTGGRPNLEGKKLLQEPNAKGPKTHPEDRALRASSLLPSMRANTGRAHEIVVGEFL